MIERAKNSDYQGKVDYKLFERTDDIKRKSKWNRCPICNRDVESIFPVGSMCVGEKTFKKMWTIFSETGARFELIKREFVKYPINYLIDELTLKPIDGIADYIDIDACRKCLAKIGHRHKFSKWQEKARFVTSSV